MSRQASSSDGGTNPKGEYLTKHFTAAQAAVLTARESQMLDLRYGFSGKEAHALAEIGARYDLSGERVRQIVNKALRRIRSRGRTKINRSENEDPCAQLLSYLQEIIRPDEPGHVDRLVAFVEDELSYLPTRTHALPLVAFLTYARKDSAKSFQEEAQQRIRDLRQSRRRERRQRWKLEQLLPYVIWPSQVCALTPEQVRGVQRQRSVSIDGDGKAGSFFSQKMKREVQYESKLEFKFLRWLEDLPEIMLYQEQPFVVSYQQGEEMNRYYPDVFFLLHDGRGIVVEIKPVFKMALQRNLVKWSALRQFCSERGFGLLVTDGRHSIQQVQHRDINPDFVKAILAALQHGPLSWKEYKGIKDRYGVGKNEFVALILQKRLVWELSPFSLSKPSASRMHSEQH